MRTSPPRSPKDSEVFRLRRAPTPPPRQRIRLVLPYLQSHTDLVNHARTVAAMASDLRADGHEVSVLVGRGRRPVPAAVTDRHLAGLPVEFLAPWSEPMDRGGPEWVVQSVALLERLKDENWDSLVLPASEGIGHATLQWLAQGHHRHPCRASVYLASRSPMVFHRARSGAFPRHPLESQRDWLERRCLELADDILLPDEASVGACLNAGWRLPASVRVAQPGLARAEYEIASPPSAPWLGLAADDPTAEPRLRQLLAAGLDPARHLGGIVLWGDAERGAGLRAMLGDDPSIPTLVNEWPDRGTRLLLVSPLALAPWRAHDLLDAGVVPIGPETKLAPLVCWISKRPLGKIWDPAQWVKALPRLGREGGTHHLALRPPDGMDSWRASFREAAAPNRRHAHGLRESVPMVSVCMTTFNRTRELEETLEAFKRQDWPNLEVVVVNDGSTCERARDLHHSLRREFAERGWLWIDQENSGPAAARNQAGLQARGEFIAFADDDNPPFPHHVTSLMKTLLVGRCDIAMAHMLKFSSPEVPASTAEAELWWMPVGGDLTYGVFGNAFGETSMAMAKQTFLTTGGFPPDREPGRIVEEDRLFLTRAALMGLKMSHFPQPTYWYRMGQVARHQWFLSDPWSCQATAVDLIDREGPAGFRGLLEFAAGQWNYRKNTLIPTGGRILEKRLSALEKESSRWRALALGLAGEASRLLECRRWKAANPTRLLRPVGSTYPSLARLISRVEALADPDPPPLNGG